MRDLELPCLGALTWPWSHLSGPERGEGYRFLALGGHVAMSDLRPQAQSGLEQLWLAAVICGETAPGSGLNQ
jgi:hypothetical protein